MYTKVNAIIKPEKSLDVKISYCSIVQILIDTKYMVFFLFFGKLRTDTHTHTHAACLYLYARITVFSN